MTTAIESIQKRTLALAAKLRWLPPLIGRLSVGYVFIESGWDKLHDLGKVAAFFGELGLPAPQFTATFTAGCELIFGLLLALGLWARIASLPLIVIMIVAILTAKREDLTGVSELLGFIEYLYILPLVWILIDGPGAVSLDRILCRPHRN